MNLTTIDQQWMDRLVDGELNESERLELLARLDLEPGAWKRCAVTFLEAQMWQSSFRAARANHSVMTRSLDSRRGKRGFVPPVVYAAIAASLLTAFTLGWSLGGRQARALPTTELARNGSDSADPSGSEIANAGVNRPGESASNADVLQAKDSAVANLDPSVNRSQPTNLAQGATGPAKQGSASKGGKEEEKQIAKAGLALPVVRAWERRGFQIEKEAQVVSMLTKDGRKVSVPVDAVRLRFIGDRIY